MSSPAPTPGPAPGPASGPASGPAPTPEPTGANPKNAGQTEEDIRLNRESKQLANDKEKYEQQQRNKTKQDEKDLKTTISIAQNPDDLKKIAELIDDIQDKETKVSFNTEMQNKLNKIRENSNKQLTRFTIPVSEAKIQEALPLILGEDTLNSSFDERINNMNDKLKSIKFDTDMKKNFLENKNIEKNIKDDLQIVSSAEQFKKDFTTILTNITNFFSELNIFGENGKIENWKYITLLLLIPSYILLNNGFNIIKFLISYFIIIICILYSLLKFNDSENKFFSNTFTIMAYPILVFIISLLTNINILDNILSFPGNKFIFIAILTIIIFGNLIYLYIIKSFPIIQFFIYIILNILYILDFYINNKELTMNNLAWVVALPGLLITLGQDNYISIITSVLFLTIITCELFKNNITYLIPENKK